MISNNEIIRDNLDLILKDIGISHKKFKNRVSFACPIHGGIKKNGASIYLGHNSGVLTWNCWTEGCEKEIGKGFINLVQAIKELSYEDTISYLEDLLGCKLSDSNNDYKSYNKNKTIQIAEEFAITKYKKKIEGVTRSLVRQSLIYPAQFFVDRGFSKEILDKYDIGFCNNPTKPMHNRVVVPVYDDNHNIMIGCLGRTIQPQCNRCRTYHSTNEPCPVSSFDEYQSSKWTNSAGFTTEDNLFNFWFAKDYINLYNIAILVEGTLDVIRLEEANIKVGLGLFGCKISDNQARKLEHLPITDIFIATDSDIAGYKAKEKIIEKLERYYQIHIINLPKKDVGDMSIQETRDFFLPRINKFYKE